MQSIPIVVSLPHSARTRRAWFVDIWGVMHNGVRPFDGAVAACRAFRNTGGKVILVSNAPRPSGAVAAQLDRIGVQKDAYDAILSSGDISRGLIENFAGRSVLHIGPERDLPLFDGLGVRLDGAGEVEAIVCTGLLDDEREIANDYRARLAPLAARQIPMICANPDLTVERGGRLIPCAGAVAAVYAELEGPVHYAGKPFPPIYDAAHALAEDLLGEKLGKSSILAIGDGLLTDIAGAARNGLDSVFIASAVSLGHGPLDEPAVARLFPDGGPRPMAAMPELVW